MANGVVLISLITGELAIGASTHVLTTPASTTQAAARTASAKPAVTAATTSPLLGVSSTWPLTTAVTTVAPAGTQTATAVSTPATPVLAPLFPLNLTTMRLWNWGGKWIGSEWSNANSPLPWKFSHINQPAGADTLFTLDAAGAPEIQAGPAEAKAEGMWESEVTLPQLRDGLVVAPLWLYDSTSRDEIDFELAGRNGLDVTMHVYVNGVHKQNSVRLFAGDRSVGPAQALWDQGRPTDRLCRDVRQREVRPALGQAHAWIFRLASDQAMAGDVGREP